jgi:hypothetical protein
MTTGHSSLTQTVPWIIGLTDALPSTGRYSVRGYDGKRWLTVRAIQVPCKLAPATVNRKYGAARCGSRSGLRPGVHAPPRSALRATQSRRQVTLQGAPHCTQGMPHSHGKRLHLVGIGGGGNCRGTGNT